jgi:hypothetical protein
VTFTPSNRELRAIPPNRFRLLTGFTYKDPEGRDHKITPRGVGNTDLASVPWFLWWFVASYGRHTAAALAHDQLVDKIDRRYADWVFRCALKESGTSWIRRWLMWAAVSFETSFRTAFKPRDSTAKYPDRREQRTGRWVTIAGFLLVFGQLAVGIVLAAGWWKPTISFLDSTWREYSYSQVVGAVLILVWFLMWRERGILLIVGIILLAWAMLGVLVTAIVIWGGVPGRLPATRDFAVSVAVSETVW